MPTFEGLLETWDGETAVIRRDHASGAWIFICLHSTRLVAPGRNRGVACHDECVSEPCPLETREDVAELAVVLNQARRKMRRDPIAAPRQPLAHASVASIPFRGDAVTVIFTSRGTCALSSSTMRADGKTSYRRLAEVEGVRLPDGLVD